MGVSSSKQTPSENVFKNELKQINDIVNSIISSDNTFINDDYNFLSDEVCESYQVVLELGEHIYVIPKENSQRISKSKICEKIAGHYSKILFVLCLIKYVYNIEKNGDLSLMGRIFRNIKITEDDFMEILYCDKNQGFTISGKSIKFDLKTIDGLSFFVNYILTPNESSAFLSIFKQLLRRNKKGNGLHDKICNAIDTNALSKEEADMIKKLYRKEITTKNVFVYKQNINKLKLTMNLYKWIIG